MRVTACPTGTLAPCRLPMDPESLPASPRCLCQPLGVVQGFPGPRVAAMAPGKGKGSFPSTTARKIPRLWLREGSMAEAGQPGQLWSWSRILTWHDTVMSAVVPAGSGSASLLVLLQVQLHSELEGRLLAASWLLFALTAS